MKKLVLFFNAVFLVGATVSAETNNVLEDNYSTNFVGRDYGNSFIFREGGIEFSVFSDGQFDFYALDYGPDVNNFINTPNSSFSFNSGYDYSPYLQYDDFGAIIQIENTPIYYDYYGRVTQIGNVDINYNDYGRVARLGGLYVHYNNAHAFTHNTGYINDYNRAYIYRPWHGYYAIPNPSYCIVYASPYRQNYTPIRYHYYTPYTNNYRQPVNYDYGRVASQNSGRRGTSVTDSRISDRYRQDATSRRSDASLSQDTSRDFQGNGSNQFGRTLDARTNQSVRNSNSERVVGASPTSRGIDLQRNGSSDRSLLSANPSRTGQGQRVNTIERNSSASTQRSTNTTRNTPTVQRQNSNRNTSVIGKITQGVNNLPNRKPNISNTRISDTKQQ